MTFCLLPVVLNVEEDSFIMDSWGVNVPPIELRFKSVILSMNSTGTIDQYGAKSVDNPHDKMVITPATLAIGMIPFFGKRKSLYAEYRLCVSENGLNDRTIGERQPWMQLPYEVNNDPLSAKAFENELTGFFASDRRLCFLSFFPHQAATKNGCPTVMVGAAVFVTGFLSVFKRPPAAFLPRHERSRPGRGRSRRRAGPWPRQ